MIPSEIWNKKARVNFKRLTKLYSPCGLVQFVVFLNFTRVYLFQIAREKSCDYLLIIYIQKFQMSFCLFLVRQLEGFYLTREIGRRISRAIMH